MVRTLRTLLLVALISIGLAACSQPTPQQSGSGGTPATSPASGDQPAPAKSPGSTSPAAAPPVRPEDPGTSASSGTAPAPATPPTAAPGAADVAPAPAPSPKPAPPPTPAFREVTIPAGTSLAVTLLDTLASDASKPEDRVRGALAKPVVISGRTAIPEGAELTGSVVSASKSGRVKGRASVAFRFEHLVVGGESYAIHTATVKREAAADTKSDVKKGAVGAGVGGIVGGVIGGGSGAAIGAVAGGAGTVLATKGKEVELPAGTAVTALLQQAITLTIPNKK